MNKRIRAVCEFCKEEWDDDIDIPNNLQYGYSVCNNCRHKLNKTDDNMKELNDMGSYFMGNPTPDNVKTMLTLTKRDRELCKDAPCTWCGAKSVVRNRCYSPDGLLFITAACEDHFTEFEESLKND